MVITIYPTSKIVTINGMEARIWEGKTAKGTPLDLCTVHVRVRPDFDQTEFEAELKNASAPSEEVEAIPNRLRL